MASTPYRDEEKGNAAASVDVRTALRAWARTEFGAPRRLDELISSVSERDEVITRVATTVIRRDLVPQRIATHDRRGRSASPEDPASLDPFSGTMEDLRRRTEHVDRCASCNGSGIGPCPACRGSGRQGCGNCSGSGKVLKHYKKSSKYINCSVCRGGGAVGCGGCLSKGTITCAGCSGSGQQLVWWTYQESVRVVVQISTDSPIVHAHPQVLEERFLGPSDLEAFLLLASVEGEGSLAGGRLSPEDDALVRRQTPALDARIERIRAQQLLRFGVLRRDVRYEMCGAEGSVVLSGASLAASSTPAAVGPIRRRLMLWGVASFVLLIGGTWYMSALLGPTSYFRATNRVIAFSSLTGMAAAIVAVGGLLRALRPSFRFWPLGTFAKLATGISAAAFLLCPVVGYFGRPSTDELQQAVAAGDLGRARLVAEALEATEPSEEEAGAIDELHLAEAERLSGDARLEKLDAIAARNGSHAGRAKTSAQRARVEAIEAALKANRAADAVGLLKRWSSKLSDTPELGELEARAFESQGVACSDDICRFGAARAAKAARSSPEREATVDRARRKVIEGIDARAVPAGDLLSRVRWLRSLSKLAVMAESSAGGDAEIQEKANAASVWARAELGKVTLIGAPVAVVDELLERDAGSASTGWPELKGVSVYVAKVGAVCSGLFVVGASPGLRFLNGNEEGLRRLLAQATGRPGATLRARAASSKTHSISTWAEGSTPVMARWNDTRLMELRIGRASP
ncbi:MULTISPECIES: hypothetical protein [Sorangium]|uniref:CR-type domain-containing protein n=1 Tax=Sorangium cellulosum TaxID=56 RepID=A0A4P2QQ89_SORCE|nr:MULTISPECIES: hypothetical protein [Sorangium]AUX32031.1 uncharacterized protein SOCE836_041670 [Sorangium cellulosum]WCQ91403.1 hypothetical protein NQZ70_04122 [Sorangium sp. Soce836]